jgi:hypothetical protein
MIICYNYDLQAKEISAFGFHGPLSCSISCLDTFPPADEHQEEDGTRPCAGNRLSGLYRRGVQVHSPAGPGH